MLFLMEKLLLLSIGLEKSSKKGIRLLGKLLGIWPVYCSRRLEKRLLEGRWNPVKRYRKRGRRIRRRKRRY